MTVVTFGGMEIGVVVLVVVEARRGLVVVERRRGRGCYYNAVG